MNFQQSTSLCKSIIGEIFHQALRSYRWQPVLTSRVRRKPHQRWPNYPMKWPGGEKHYKFTYYPRYPDQEDPEWKPSPLFLIVRRKGVRGTPFWEKQLLKDFRIEQPSCRTNIVINDEVTNANLWKIKHLITIIPITFPDGYPSEKDIGNCHLYENGEFHINANLGVNDERLKATEKCHEKTNSIDKYMIEKYTRRHWNRAYLNVLKDA